MELPYSGATARSNPCTSSPFWFLLDRVTKRTGKLVRQKWTAQWRKKYQILRNCVKIQSKRQQIKEKERERDNSKNEKIKKKERRRNFTDRNCRRDFRAPSAFAACDWLGSASIFFVSGDWVRWLIAQKMGSDWGETSVFFRRPWRFRLASSRAWGFLYAFLSTKFACNFVWSVWRGNSGFVSYRGK